MEVLGIGPLELLLIAIVALLVVKPEDWGKTGRTIANWINQITSSDAWRAINESWRAASQLSTDLRREVNLENSLRELDEFTNPGLYHPSPTRYSKPGSSSPPVAGTPETGTPETNVIHPPHSTPFVAASTMQAQKKAAAKKAATRKPAKKKSTSPAPVKRKSKKTNA